MQYINWEKMFYVHTESITNHSECSYFQLVTFGMYLMQEQMNKLDNTGED